MSLGAMSAPAPEPAVPREKCPHCGNTTLIEPSSTLVFQCGVCGKARVPMGLPDHERSNAELPSLARASSASTASLAWLAGSGVLAAFSAISLLTIGLVLSAMNPGTVPLLFGLLISLIPGGLAAYGFRRGARLRTQVQPALEEGWLRAAREVVEVKGTIDDAGLAKILQVTPERAESLLLQLAATSPVRHHIEDPSSLGFDAPRVRVAAQGDGKKADPDDEISEAEAAAAEGTPASARRREGQP